MPTETSKLEEIQFIDWQEAFVSFYVVKRKTVKRKAKYEVFSVNIHNDLQKKLRKILESRLDESTGTEEYDYFTSDQDSTLLTLALDETDAKQVIKQITAKQQPEQVVDKDQLLDTWFYVARFDVDNTHRPLFAVRKTPRGWATEKDRNMVSVFFSDAMELSIEDRPTFKVDNNFDFFVFDEGIFILNKKSFERDLNFREGLIKKRKELMAEFSKSDLLEIPSDLNLNDEIGDNMNLLRKCAQVKKSKYYKDKDFIINLREENSPRNLGLTFTKNGALIINRDKMPIILHLLTNGRLESIINDEVFDVDVKKKVDLKKKGES